MKYGQVFASENTCSSPIKDAGEKAQVCRSGGGKESLNELRKNKFFKRVIKSIQSGEVK